MSILTADNLGLSFGAFDLFKGVSVTIANDSKIGLIGPTALAKHRCCSSWLGSTSQPTGKVYLAKGRRLGYLRQEAVDAFADRSHTVYAEMLTVFATCKPSRALARVGSAHGGRRSFGRAARRIRSRAGSLRTGRRL